MNKLKIALVQFEISLGQPAENLRRLRSRLKEAGAAGAQLALLPELWSTGYDLERAAELASEKNGPIFREISEMAQEFSLYLCGSILEAERGRYFNTQLLCSPQGSFLANYRKIHLFGLMSEPE